MDNLTEVITSVAFHPLHCSVIMFNFYLFPKDELEAGMPYYSFSCQPSYLAFMAREDFDFNVCIMMVCRTCPEHKNLSKTSNRKSSFKWFGELVGYDCQF
nr:poly(A)-specific ribonuclease PARN-like [Tanacetum cinerariifolium]